MTSAETTSTATDIAKTPQTPVVASTAVAATPAAAVKTPAKRVVRSAAPKVAAATPAVVSTTAKPATKPAVKAAVKAVAKTASKAVTLPVAQTPAKAVVKIAVKTTAKAEPKVAKVAAVKPKSDKLLKDKKAKLVRDSFTIPKLEYLLLDQLKQRSGTLGTAVKKSELIRAGIKALAAMADAGFLAAVKAVPTIKTGRPSKG
jgi:hypothetical protein